MAARAGRHLDLLSIFTSEDLFEVRCGNKEIGKVDRSSFTLKKEQGVLLLAGRPWTVMEINWKRRVVQVEPSRERGKSRWLGDGPAMPYELCQAIRRVVCRRDDAGTRLTARAIDALSDARSELYWFHPEATTLVVEGDGKLKWYTHGGTVANVRLAWRLGQMLDQKTGCDEHAISFAVGVKIGEAKAAIEQVKADQLSFDPAAFRPLAEKLKFHDTLPEPRIAELVQARYEALDEVRKIVAEPTIEAS